MYNWYTLWLTYLGDVVDENATINRKPKDGFDWLGRASKRMADSSTIDGATEAQCPDVGG